MPPDETTPAIVGIKGLIDETRFRLAEVDASTHALIALTHAENDVHNGEMFSACVIDSDFDKADILTIVLTTPDATKEIHLQTSAYATTFAIAQLLRGPTITNGTGVDYVPRNRNERSSNVSAVSNAMAAPTANMVRVNATVAAVGFIMCEKVVGAGRTGAGSMASQSGMSRWVLARNTTYALRLQGTNVGSDNQIGGINLVWSEHTPKD